MNRERAEAHLRLLAEAELREATTVSSGGGVNRRHAGRLALVAPALFAVGAVDLETADEIQAGLHLALALRPPGPAGRAHVAVSRDLGATRSASRSASWRVVPAGQVIRIRDDEFRAELRLLAYAQTTDGGRFTAAGWVEGSPPGARPGRHPYSRLPPVPVPRRFHFTAMDDQGTTYRLGSSARPFGRQQWYGVLDLRPNPPPGIRWLDLCAPGQPATRINLDPEDPPGPAPRVAVTPTAASPGELLLDVVAARLLALAATFPQSTPEELAAARPEPIPHAPSWLGDLVTALHAAEALPVASPVPGQLAGLCRRLGVTDHGISAPPADNLPEPWLSMLTRYHRRKPYAAFGPGARAATAVELPELDGARFALLGLHGCTLAGDRPSTVLHMLASGVTPEDDWAYMRVIRPLPVLWIRDSGGRWHTVAANGYHQPKYGDEVTLTLTIVPPLERGTAWIEVVATGQAAEARVTVPLRWEPDLPGTARHG